ncbi:hypothetical protein T310_8127 [Rasamsonia emersonii CBS 393.64]|uniref:C2H2-type domain-containing protein n=1 Tax=Rasamsonia emersonii (strain ATCC 16479 / CBS 393.64 / IMI 116815) TaxID=1408163 RepID=A0A0F4YI13_RASE3|nr:hypothetical protein T310_8127 [Rasamsonia emersonii CBS 393.64]KKA17927.1 hypothetical protein T310_8127 [Rasamsonia emersonii CBS 393.64]
MSSKRGENSRGYRSQGRRIAEESTPSTGAEFHVLDPSGGPLSLESPTQQHQHQQQQFFTEFQPASFSELPVDLQGGLQLSHLETAYSTAISEQQQQQQQSLPQTNLYEGSHQLQDPLLPLESVPSESSPAEDSTDVARQSQVFSAENPSAVNLLPPSYSGGEAYIPESMYASLQTYYPSSIPSLHSQQFAGNIEGALSQSQPFLASSDSTNMFPNNRQPNSFSPAPGQWTQYDRSVGRTHTPEQPPQRRPDEPLPPFSAPNAYSSSQAPVYPTAPYPLGVQQAPNQQFYPPSAAYNFNQPNYDIPQTSFVPSTPYPITTSPDSRIPVAPSPFVTPGSTAGTPEPESQVRVIESRPKPQCWDHGCNGREFSTFSNLLRHQRERSGAAAKSECPHCGAVFTRTTARNTHIAQGKCKGLKESSQSTTTG